MADQNLGNVTKSGGKKNAPRPPDYEAATEKQSQANAQLNRPDVSTPYASQQWTQGPDGQWRMNTSFSGALGGAAGALNQQAADALGKPLDLSGLPELDSGAGARDQAINAAYGQAASRLNPQWEQREGQLRQRLANQGLDPDSEAGRNAMRQLGQERNDAYSSAMSGAISQGTAAGDSVFRNSAMARQQALAEALRKRGQPLEELGALQGFLKMPGYSQVEGPQYLNAALAKYQGDTAKYKADQEAWADSLGALGSLAALPFKM
ncbi:MAG TPA: hypothetical protein VFP50_15405 [Anaeromyxobacteraceae bacterium]|nr:hypothetical protein [Anaeromyxobacteraceae bacterium]